MLAGREPETDFGDRWDNRVGVTHGFLPPLVAGIRRRSARQKQIRKTGRPLKGASVFRVFSASSSLPYLFFARLASRCRAFKALAGITDDFISDFRFPAFEAV